MLDNLRLSLRHLIDQLGSFARDHPYQVGFHICILTLITFTYLLSKPPEVSQTSIEKAKALDEQIKNARQRVEQEFGTMASNPAAAQSIAHAGAQSASANLPPPKNDPISTQELSKHDGSDTSVPIWVSVKGHVFDVSSSDSYGPGGSYHIFAGKDPSKALGKSSLKPEDCVADISSLDEKEKKTLEEWETFFAKRYPQIGKLSA